MPTRIISWQQLVLEADPDWQRQKSRPPTYRFSNNRQFYWSADSYNFGRYLTDDLGNLIRDDRGNAIPIT
jgi:hypothetical protein